MGSNGTRNDPAGRTCQIARADRFLLLYQYILQTFSDCIQGKRISGVNGLIDSEIYHSYLPG